VYTRVAWRPKALTFADELKLQLPVDLSPAHHLLFTVVEIDEVPLCACALNVHA
jgi:hypothetical protein